MAKNNQMEADARARNEQRRQAAEQAQAAPADTATAAGCPFCKKTVAPNAGRVLNGSNRWWSCESCGHEWAAEATR